MTLWKVSCKRRGPARKGATVQLGKSSKPSDAKLRVLYAGYSKTLRPKILGEPDWTNAMTAKVTAGIRSYWDRRVSKASVDGPAVSPNLFGGETAGAILPRAPLADLFKQLEGAETVVLFGHVKVTRAKETATVMGTWLCLFENRKNHRWLTSDQVVAMLPKTVKSVYVLGCRSNPFAERLAGLRPGLQVFGIAADMRVYESAANVEAPATYDIFMYPESTKKGQESQNRREIDFTEHLSPGLHGRAP